MFTADSGKNPFDAKRNPDAFAHWNVLAPKFLQLGLLTVVSRETLMHICSVYEDAEIFSTKIREEGLFVDYPVFSRKTGEQTGTVERENNAQKPWKQSIELYNRLMGEFGGTPATASRVQSQIKKSAPKLVNPFSFVR
jgi:hypothetical protein